MFASDLRSRAAHRIAKGDKQMPLLQIANPDKSEGLVAEVYREIQKSFGFIPNAIRMDSVNPNHMARHWASFQEVLQHPTLSQNLSTTIRMIVSERHHCKYCVDLNGAFLMQSAELTLDQLRAVCDDPGQAPLSEKEKALLLFSLRAIADSNAVSGDDIRALRDKGASEREIFDTLAHAAEQVASDILLNAFKVEPDGQ